MRVKNSSKTFWPSSLQAITVIRVRPSKRITGLAFVTALWLVVTFLGNAFDCFHSPPIQGDKQASIERGKMALPGNILASSTDIRFIGFRSVPSKGFALAISLAYSAFSRLDPASQRSPVDVPPELWHTWQFTLRTASHPRSPCPA